VRLGAAGLAGALFTMLAVATLRDPSLAVPLTAPTADFGSVEQVGTLLFEQYGLQFELVSVLIIVAMFGAVVLAKKRLWTT
jgi:NADH:ubiquinone oxidoreductase subunit 6 (subunit J)